MVGTASVESVQAGTKLLDIPLSPDNNMTVLWVVQIHLFWTRNVEFPPFKGKGCMDGWTDGWSMDNRWMDWWMDGQTDIWMDGQLDGCLVFIHFPYYLKAYTAIHKI